MATIDGRVVASSTRGTPRMGAGQRAIGWLLGRGRLVIAAVAVLAAVPLAVGQHWLVAADLVPLLFVLPCALMMFICMKGMSHGQQGEPAPIPVRRETLLITDGRNRRD